MAFQFTFGADKAILKRIRKDSVTRLRLKYKPYYHAFERQEGSRVWLDGQELVMLASNDYLGLGDHPKVVEAAQAAIRKWGTSTTGARVANGSRAYHHELEEAVAAFIGAEACHVHAAGYLSCVSAIQPFCQRGDLILIDKNAHSSLMSGAKLAGVRIERFAHNNPDDLRDILNYEDADHPKMLVFEGVYSMEGHIAPVGQLLNIAREYGCFTVMDDAHGFGVLGPGGRGTASHTETVGDIDVTCGSFSKALSSTGGFVCGSTDVIEYLRTHSKQTIFSAALPPSQAAAALAALRVLQDEPEHLQRLWANTRRFRRILIDLGLDTWESETPAIPIVLGNKERVYHFWRALLKKGVFSVMSIAPGVPPGKDLIRTSISARHSEEDLAIIAEAMAFAARQA
ncbi:MAG: aminotransferase class I/II-fold pyridoxal phosphate-dependent enzyme [Opitutales bacterium]